MKIWSCKIGEVEPDRLPHEIPLEVPGSLSAPRMLSADQWMRRAVEMAYERLTGEKCTFTFSGWGAELDESERAVVEDREPDYFKTRWLEERVHTIRETVRAGEPPPEWAPEQWIAAAMVKLGQAAQFLHDGQYGGGISNRAILAEGRQMGVENLLACAAVCLEAVEAIEGPPL